MCFFLSRLLQFAPRHQCVIIMEVVDKSLRKLAYLKDSNAAAHSVDSDIFQDSDSSICALQDLTLTFIF